MVNRSVWLSEQEDRLVRELAAHNGTSLNMVIRVALRQLGGLPAPKLEPPPAKVADRS